MDLLYKTECYAIQGAIYEVYKTMGSGFLESIYHECLKEEFYKSGIPFKSEYDIIVNYKDVILHNKFRADFVCYDKIIVEIKAVKNLEGIHSAQVLNYLKATGLKLGILVNFCSYPQVDIQRLVF